VRLSTRLLLAGVVAPVTALVLALGLVGALLDRALREAIDRGLLAQAAVESVSLFDRLGHAGHLHLDRSPLRAAASDSPAWGALYGPDGARRVVTPETARVPLRVTLPRLGAPPALTTAPGPRSAGQRVLLVTVASPEGEPHALRLALPLDRHRDTMRSYARLAITVGVLATVALLVLQTSLLRVLHRRIADLGTHMARLGRGDLTHPPATDATGDELSALRDAIAGATAELREARDARERLLANAAHELRTPLAAIRADVDVTLRRERSPAELRDALERVRDDVARLATLARQLLDLAAGASRARPLAPGDLAATAADAAASLASLAESRGVTLTVEGAASGRFDAEAMQQAIVNLVDNALRVSAAGARVRVCVAREGEALSLAVEDAGRGVPEAERARVFEPFYRLDRGGSGAGLGLAIVRDIMLRHGGVARVEEAPDGGARFVLRWPA